MNDSVPNLLLRRASIRTGQLAIATLLLGLFVTQAEAATKKAAAKRAPQEEVYRCRTANGQSIFGQSIPPECMDKDVEVLDATGRVVRTIPGRKSLEVVALQKADEEAKAVAAERDRTLLATYLSVADIERLRDQRLELLVQQNVVTRQYIANLRARQERLIQSAQRFRPYSVNKNAAPLPDQISAEIVNTVKGLQVYEQELTKNTAERSKLSADFNADIARFKELKGG
jgi:hypothetical protein